MGTLLHSCVEVRKLIKLSFGVVIVVGLGIGVLDKGRRAARGRGFWGFAEFFPIRFNGALLSRNVLDSCVKS